MPCSRPFDTLALEARLPPQKSTKIRWGLIATFITGYLDFCAKVAPVGRSYLGRSYLGRLYDAAASLQAGHPHKTENSFYRTAHHLNASPRLRSRLTLSSALTFPSERRFRPLPASDTRPAYPAEELAQFFCRRAEENRQEAQSILNTPHSAVCPKQARKEQTPEAVNRYLPGAGGK